MGHPLRFRNAPCGPGGAVVIFDFRASDNCYIMSDMASERITIRVPAELGQRISKRSRMKGQTESDLVREALEGYFRNGRAGEERSAYELAAEAGLIGCVRRAAKDLSTNRRHFEGFGKRK